MKQGEKEIYILIYIFSLYNIMSKRKRNSKEEINKEIENNNEPIMEKYRKRRQRQQRQQSSYKTPNHSIRDLKFLPEDPNVSKKRRKDGKLERPTSKRFYGDKILGRNDPRKRPSNPLQRTLHKKQKEWDAALESDEKTAVDSLLNLRKGTRKKLKKKRKKKRTKRNSTKKKHKKKRTKKKSRKK
jgi:hypothetical protein